MRVSQFLIAAVLGTAFAGSVQGATVQNPDAVNLPGTIFNTDPTLTFGDVDYQIGWTVNQWRSPFQHDDQSKITPLHDSQKYLSIQADASAVWSGIGTAVSLFWGSPDSYNIIEFYKSSDGSGTPFDSITGSALVGPGQFGVGHVLVTILASETFNSVRLYSGNNAFELTNFQILCERCSIDVVTTPVPGALPLFASGLGMLGFYGWRRRRNA